MSPLAARNDSGFTIVEALVAFAILAVMLVSVFEAGGAALHSLARGEDVDRAILLARSKLAEIEAGRAPLPAKDEGDFQGSPVRWRIDARDVQPVTGGVTQLQDVHLVVTWSDDGIAKTIAVDTRHLAWVPK